MKEQNSVIALSFLLLDQAGMYYKLAHYTQGMILNTLY